MQMIRDWKDIAKQLPRLRISMKLWLFNSNKYLIMIKNYPLTKLFVQYFLHPCPLISAFSTYRPRQWNPQGSFRRPTYQLKDFKTYCQLLDSHQQTHVIKNILSVPKADSDLIQNFKQQARCQAPLSTILTDFTQFPQDVIAILHKIGITSPTPIQQAIIPPILDGSDVIAIAETGSGKTLAFALPGVLHIRAQEKCRGPRILVLAPTRELANQIEAQYSAFVRSVCLYGGVDKQLQIKKLQVEPEVLVATPGRLCDLIEMGLSLKTITQVVLDEADRMLDMGFEDQIRKVLSQVRADRQTLFFSATWPVEVRRLAESFCSSNPLRIQLGEGHMSVNLQIEQKLIVSEGEKFKKFLQYLKDESPQKILVFCERKVDTEKLEQQLWSQNIQARFFHGDLSQLQRSNILQDFREGRIQCLITTNLASRGLDVQDVDVVINYDFPQNIEDYIHRIGRTGRAGRKGKAVSFVEPRFLSHKMKQNVVQVMKQAKQSVPEEFMQIRVQ